MQHATCNSDSKPAAPETMKRNVTGETLANRQADHNQAVRRRDLVV